MAGTRPLTPKEEAIVAQALGRFAPRDQALFTMLAHCGYRIAETLSLNVGDVWEGGRIRPRVKVNRAKRKGGHGYWKASVRSRSVILNPVVSAALEAYLFSRFGSAGPADAKSPLFLSRQGGGRLSRWQANRVVHTVLSEAGVGTGAGRGELGTQSLRKTFARRVYLAADRDILVCRAAMGHASVATTQRYVEIETDAVDRAVLAMGTADNGPRREIQGLQTRECCS